MLIALLEFILGMMYANAGEWFMHKYILHALGKNPGSFWAYHLYEHHAVSSKNNMLDLGYQKITLTHWNTQSKELVVLAVIVGLHLPLGMNFPIFVTTVYGSMVVYYYKHRKAHLDPTWAKQHLRWHYDHHQCGKTAANWCVTWPWFDYVMGTHIKVDSAE